MTNSHRMKLKLCSKTFNVTAMGKSAFKSHTKSAKHIGSQNRARECAEKLPDACVDRAVHYSISIAIAKPKQCF